MIDFSIEKHGKKILVRCGEDMHDQAMALLEKFYSFTTTDDFSLPFAIEFGWAPLKLVQESTTCFRIYEPDFDTNPFQHFRPSVDFTLRVLKEQVALLNTLKLSGDSPKFNQKVLVNGDCLQNSQMVLIREKVQRDDDSGWTLDSPAQETNQWKGSWVYQIYQQRFSLAAVMALPAGYYCQFQGDMIASITNHEGKVIWSDREFLDAKNQS